MKLWGNQIFVKQIKSVFHSFLLKINLLHFRIFHLSNKKSKIIFIDIDNTIANTAGFIKKNNIFDSKNAMSISPLNGTIDFINGNKMFLSDSIYNHQPKVGDVILFPNYLMHTAYPFKTNGERRSFSFNLEIDNNVANVFSR